VAHYPKGRKYKEVLATEFLGKRYFINPVLKKKVIADQCFYLKEISMISGQNLQNNRGGQTINKEVTLATIPIYVRAGAIIPIVQ